MAKPSKTSSSKKASKRASSDFAAKAGGKKASAQKNERVNKPVNVAFVKLHGAIMPDEESEKGTLSWDNCEPAIAAAFAMKDSKAVVLDIDSPGGSPAEADLIAREIRYQAKIHNKPVYAFVRGAAASGGYWIACAADQIYALPVSDVGSVGVISSGFGFHKKNKKEGIERRVFTSGTRKSQLDAYLPLKKKDIEKQSQDLAKIHDEFRKWVLSRRGDRLKGTPEELLNGDAWIGDQALKRGLIDGIGFFKEVICDLLNKPVAFTVFEPTRKESLSLADLFSGMIANDNEGDEADGESRYRKAPIKAVSTRPRILAL